MEELKGYYVAYKGYTSKDDYDNGASPVIEGIMDLLPAPLTEKEIEEKEKAEMVWGIEEQRALRLKDFNRVDDLKRRWAGGIKTVDDVLAPKVDGVR